MGLIITRDEDVKDVREVPENENELQLTEFEEGTYNYLSIEITLQLYN